MRVKSDAAPPSAFIVEPMPGQPGKSRIRFFENAEQITERKHWEFDEYHLVVDEQSLESKIPALEAQLSALKKQIAK